MSKYQQLRQRLIENSNPEIASQMESYLKNKFKFFGLKSPERRESYHDLIKLKKANKKIDWDFLDQAWADEHREAQYFVCDYLIALEKYLTFEDIDHIFNYVKSKQWWDTIDHQLLRKDKMNVKLLNAILENNLSSSEFFINKAIGWALRDYSKTNPDWVKNFISKHHNELATL